MARTLRRTAILAGVAVCGGLAAASGWWYARASAPVNGPIVLVTVDALRADRLRAYGYAAGRTPAIDALASDGIVFDRAYAHVPQTLPAHASLLTGRLPFESGVRDAAGPPLGEQTRTVAETLRDRGYATGGVVSSWLLRRDTGIARGFTFFDDERPAAATGGEPEPLMRDGVDTEQVAERWMDTVGTTRLFLFLHLADPHAPHSPPERFADLPPYDGEVAHADEAVGRLVRYLKSHQMYDRSTIILVADHGEALGGHGERTHGLLVTEESLRVPLIVKLPGGEAAGVHVPDVVQHVDLVPTILDLAKAPAPSGLSGRSLASAFEGRSLPAVPVYAESYLGTYRFGWSPVVSIVEGQYRLTRGGAAPELYDLAADPAGRRNIASEHADIVARLERLLSSLLPQAGDGPAPTVTAGDQEHLASLGYVGMPTQPAEPDGPPAGVVAFERYRDAVALAARRDWDAALAVFRGLAEEMPPSTDLWLQVARTAAHGERHEAATEAYLRVLELAPADVAAHLGAAASFLRTRKFESAETHARAALADQGLSPVQRAEAQELLARLLFERREFAAARAAAAEAQEADPERPVGAFLEGRIAAAEGRWADAAASFTAALGAAERSGRLPLTDLRVLAADALVHLQRFDEAEPLLLEELRVFPANQRARASLQMLYRATGRRPDGTSRSRDSGQ